MPFSAPEVCSPLQYKSMDFSGRRILVWFPYSVLLGSTVDTCLRQFIEAQSSYCRKLRILRSCSSSSVVDILFVPQRQIPMVLTIQQTTEIPQLPFVFWCRCHCCAGRAGSFPRRAAVAVPMVQTVLRTIFFLSCCTRWSTSLFPGRAGSLPRRGAEAGPWSKLFV